MVNGRSYGLIDERFAPIQEKYASIDATCAATFVTVAVIHANTFRTGATALHRRNCRLTGVRLELTHTSFTWTSAILEVTGVIVAVTFAIFIVTRGMHVETD